MMISSDLNHKRKNKNMADTKTFKYNQDDKVYFSMGEGLPNGWGKVCGAVGPVIIVELEKTITGYPFTHTYVIDSQIKEPPKENVG